MHRDCRDDGLETFASGPGLLLLLPMAGVLLLTAPACGGDGGETDPCSSCLPEQECDEEAGICVEPGPAGLAGTDLAPHIAGTWEDGNPVVLVYDRIGERFLVGSAAGAGMTWETAAVADVPLPPPGGPQTALVEAGQSPAFLVETAPGELSLVRRDGGKWSRSPGGKMPGPLSHLASAQDGGPAFHACAGDANRGLWFAEATAESVQWEQVQVDVPEGVPASPCAMAIAGGQPLLFSVLRPAGLVSLWRDQDGTWQHAVIDAEAVPLALSVAPTEKGLATAWIDGKTGELRVARGQAGVIEVSSAAAVSPESAAACAVSLATSASGLLRVAFRDAGTGQLVLLGPQPSGGGWEPLASVSQPHPFLPLLGFDSPGAAAAAVGVETPPAGQAGPGIYKRIEFSQALPE